MKLDQIQFCEIKDIYKFLPEHSNQAKEKRSFQMIVSAGSNPFLP